MMPLRPRTGAAPLFWHPHQRLWNRRLEGAIRRRLPRSIGNAVIAAVVHVDTLLLAGVVAARRIHTLGPSSLMTTRRLPDHVRVIHLDLGTHVDAGELKMVAQLLPRWCGQWSLVGFEADDAACEAARAATEGIPGIRMVHAAMCRDVPASGRVTLYDRKVGPSAKGPGAGASLYRRGDAIGKDVPALRLSEWLQHEGLADGRSVITLRMNIEGAEYDVIHDLVDAGLLRHIDGYYGLWDDVGKVDRERGQAFREFVRGEHVQPLTFNGRDLRWRWRRAVIAYDLVTSILGGARRVSNMNRPAGAAS